MEGTTNHAGNKWVRNGDPDNSDKDRPSPKKPRMDESTSQTKSSTHSQHTQVGGRKGKQCPTADVIPEVQVTLQSLVKSVVEQFQTARNIPESENIEKRMVNNETCQLEADKMT